MIEILPELVGIILLVFCLIDCIQTDSALVRNLPKIVWILLIVFLPLIGSVAWLVAGHPWPASSGNQVPWRSTATAGFPEYERPGASRAASAIDDQLRRDQERVDREHEEALRRWEASLRERERKLDDPDATA